MAPAGGKDALFQVTCPACGHVTTADTDDELLHACANHENRCVPPAGSELTLSFPGLAAILEEDDMETLQPELMPGLVDDDDDSDGWESDDSDDLPMDGPIQDEFRSYLATLAEARDVSQVSGEAMEKLKDGTAKYVRALAETIGKNISSSEEIPLSKVLKQLQPLLNLHSSIDSTRREASQFDQLFDTVHACKPRLMGHDEDGRPEYVYDMHFIRQLNDLLDSDELLQDVLREMPQEHGVSSDVRHGAVWRSHPMVRARVDPLLVQLFTDAMEVTNPLGAARCKWKFVFGYWSLLNLSSQHQTKRDNMRLAFICSASVFKKYGPAAIISGARADGSFDAECTSFGSWMERGEEGTCCTRATCD